jgi:uncharacterized membrane protein YkvA (DUF1232 family)
MTNRQDILRNQNSGFFQNLVMRGRLIWRLMADRRVNFFLKILPVAALIYLVSPIDFLPGVVIPFIGVLDDAAVIWLGATLFVNLCPEDVVEEHLNALKKVVTGTWRDAPQAEMDDNEVIEVEAIEPTGDK